MEHLPQVSGFLEFLLVVSLLHRFLLGFGGFGFGVGLGFLFGGFGGVYGVIWV